MSRIIPIDDAIQMKNEYKNYINPLIAQRAPNYTPTDFGWIKIEDLRKYLTLLEQVEKVNDKSISGVRIYFSAYPDSPVFRSSGEEVPESARETFFLVPTVQVESTSASQEYENLEHLPFCIKPIDASVNELEGEFVVINGLLNEHDNSSRTTDEDYSNKTSLVLNEMSLTPPPS